MEKERFSSHFWFLLLPPWAWPTPPDTETEQDALCPGQRLVDTSFPSPQTRWKTAYSSGRDLGVAEGTVTALARFLPAGLQSPLEVGFQCASPSGISALRLLVLTMVPTPAGVYSLHKVWLPLGPQGHTGLSQKMGASLILEQRVSNLSGDL